LVDFSSKLDKFSGNGSLKRAAGKYRNKYGGWVIADLRNQYLFYKDEQTVHRRRNLFRASTLF
jgi:hypothetical protein